MSDLEPLDSDLRDLFADERASYVEDHAARDAVHRRLQAALLLAPLAVGAVAKAATVVGAGAAGAASGAAASGATGGAGGAVAGGAAAGGAAGGVAGAAGGVAGALGWKTIAIASVVAFAGGVAANEVRHAATSSSPVSVVSASDRLGGAGSALADASSVGASSAVVAAPAASAVTALVGANGPDVARSVSPAHAAPSAAPANVAPSSASHASATNAGGPAGDIAAERALIDTARTALARGLASDALTATDAHAKRFPRGSLGEEREAIAIQALAATGARAAARSRAERFRKTYPSSIFGAAVQSAAEGPP